MTDEFRSFADRWVDAVLLSDEQLTDRIEEDGIDILVDLTGHTGGSRLGMFSRKPAPIQVSAWGAPTGTGLQDHRLHLCGPGRDPGSSAAPSSPKRSTICRAC